VTAGYAAGSRDPAGRAPIKVVAFGGGHGLAASLRALRHAESALDLEITAIVTVGDNGGSSGRLRVERDAQLPPGDLRMALAALADDDPTHQRTVALMQHRFALVDKPDRSTETDPTRSTNPATAGGGKPGATAGAESAGVGKPGVTAGAELSGGGKPGVTPGAELSGGGKPGVAPGAELSGGGKPAGTPEPEPAGGGEPSATPEAEPTSGGKPRVLADLPGKPGRALAATGGGMADPLAGHAVGNLLLLGLMELLGDPVEALEHAGRMVGAQGRVLPMARHAVGIEADVRGGDPDRPDEVVTVQGQHAVAVTTGHVEAVRITPASPPASPQALAAIAAADWLIFGPGSWYTSVLPHLLVPELAAAIVASPAHRLVTLNLAADNETAGLSVADHLAALHWYLPQLHVDTVLADAKWVGEPDPVHRAAQALGAQLVLAPLAVADGSARHDPESLGVALVPVLGAAR